MVQIWTDAVVALVAGVAAVLAFWAVLRARDITRLHDGLVAVLRDHGVLRMSMADEAGMRESHPNAEVTGPQRLPTAAVAQDTDHTPPPALPDGTLVWDWLRHYTHDPEQTLHGAVDTFYTRARGDSVVGPYLLNVKREELDRKFLAMAIILLKHGVTRRLMLSMARAHAGVCDPDGTPITGDVFDWTIAIFAGVLGEAGVPKAAIAAIAATVNPPAPLPSLREAIVVEA